MLCLVLVGAGAALWAAMMLIDAPYDARAMGNECMEPVMGGGDGVSSTLPGA